MGVSEARKALEALEGVRVSVDEPMSRHTTLRLGGPADLFVRIFDQSAALATLDILSSENCPWMVMGHGSNLLVTDEGIEGAVLLLDGEFADVSFDDGPQGPIVNVGASVKVSRLLSEVDRANYGGLEFLTGIPATVGGVIAMNGGTRYGYIESVLGSITIADRGLVRDLNGASLKMTYRNGNIPDGVIILSATLSLVSDPGPQHRAVAQELASLRERNHPPLAGSCGSFFKNPDPATGLFAGRLIESAGLKGLLVGDAEVSQKHANFLVNRGKATASQLLELAERVRSVVRENSGVELYREVRVVGRGADQWRVRVP